ncbi:IS200/IS605 family transposase [Rhodococcus qingshengii]|uniref:IS200/IS605 family transposase n=1 Tax=Rhodococcus qingshengii TaxID=334542 RepID=UPI0021B10CB9|nr:IS200/IS605 family transposase [Rhodococcus qingshengii]MCT6735267.1 IS200/IS605 family transposase [Rhodococcus qingshengii]
MGIDRQKYRTGRHVVFSLHAHIVLVTKYRRGAITDRVREHLIATTRDVCERFETTLLEADGEDDHLHLLVDYPPKVSLSKLVGAIKTNTSLRVRRENFPEVTQALWGDHFWSPSYFVTSTGGAPLERVAAYVRAQREPSRAPGKPKPQPR